MHAVTLHTLHHTLAPSALTVPQFWRLQRSTVWLYQRAPAKWKFCGRPSSGQSSGSIGVLPFASLARRNAWWCMTTYNRYSSFELGDNCGSIATWDRPTSRQSFLAVLTHFVLRIHTNSSHQLPTKKSDIANRFNDPNFLKDSNNLTIRRRSHALTFDHLTLNFLVHRVSCDQTLPNLSEIEQFVAESLTIYHTVSDKTPSRSQLKQKIQICEQSRLTPRAHKWCVFV